METATPFTIEKDAAVDMLRRYIATRSGIDRRNYQRDYRDVDGYRAFREDYKEILRDGRDARSLLAYVAGRDGISAADILSASNGNGRLKFERTETGYRLEYTAGQYFATEYRAAACSLLAEVIWNYHAESGYTPEQIQRELAGFLGRGIVDRWFR